MENSQTINLALRKTKLIYAVNWFIIGSLVVRYLQDCLWEVTGCEHSLQIILMANLHSIKRFSLDLNLDMYSFLILMLALSLHCNIL